MAMHQGDGQPGQAAVSRFSSYRRRTLRAYLWVWPIWSALSVWHVVGSRLDHVDLATAGDIGASVAGAALLSIPVAALIALWPRRFSWSGWFTPALAALALALLLLATDLVVQNVQADRLLTAMEQANAPGLSLNENATQAVRKLAPNISNTNVGEYRAEFKQGIEAACGDTLQAQTIANAELSDVTVLPWHTGQATAKQRFLEHGHAWATHLANCARDVVNYDNEADTAVIRATWTRTTQAMPDVVPRISTQSIRDRAHQLTDS